MADRPGLLVLLTGMTPPGGIQSYAFHLVRALSRWEARPRLDVVLRADRSIDGWDDRLSPPVNRPRFHPCGSSRPAAEKLHFLSRVASVALARRPELLVCGHPNFLPPVLLLKRALGIPYVLATYGLELKQISPRRLGLGLQQARRVWAISRFTRDQIRSKIPASRPTIDLISPPVDFQQFSPGRPSPGFLEKHGLRGKKIALTVGRLAPYERYKGHDQVIEAVARLRTEHPDLVYVIVGDGGDRDRLQRLAQERGVADRIRFVGEVPPEDRLDAYRACDVFIMPSWGEGFGIVFVEALACGKTVIAGNGDGARDALLDGDLGLMVEPGDLGAVAGALDSVLRGRVPPALRDPGMLRRGAMEAHGCDVFEKRVWASLSAAIGLGGE